MTGLLLPAVILIPQVRYFVFITCNRHNILEKPTNPPATTGGTGNEEVTGNKVIP